MALNLIPWEIAELQRLNKNGAQSSPSEASNGPDGLRPKPSSASFALKAAGRRKRAPRLSRTVTALRSPILAGKSERLFCFARLPSILGRKQSEMLAKLALEILGNPLAISAGASPRLPSTATAAFFFCLQPKRRLANNLRFREARSCSTLRSRPGNSASSISTMRGFCLRRW